MMLMLLISVYAALDRLPLQYLLCLFKRDSSLMAASHMGRSQGQQCSYCDEHRVIDHHWQARW